MKSKIIPPVADTEEMTLTVSHFGYSSITLDALNDVGTRFTLVNAILDVSGSTRPFIKDMEASLGEVARSCGSSPERDTFLFRVVRFSNRMDEVHGFLPLSDCPPDRYKGSLDTHSLGAMTALYDAVINGLEALRTEARRLGQADFDVNVALFVITDGQDNESTMSVKDVKREFGRVAKEELCESILPILIGVNVGNDPEGQAINASLESFATEAGFAQYVQMPDASAKTLAKLAKFIAQSASSQSQSLGTGGASKPINLSSI